MSLEACRWCGSVKLCDCVVRMHCPDAGKQGHTMCGMQECGCPKAFACAGHPKTDLHVALCANTGPALCGADDPSGTLSVFVYARSIKGASMYPSGSERWCPCCEALIGAGAFA